MKCISIAWLMRLEKNKTSSISMACCTTQNRGYGVTVLFEVATDNQFDILKENSMGMYSIILLL